VRRRADTQALESWRLAERRLALRDPDATDFEDICREAERLRLEYQRAISAEVAAANQSDQVIPPTGSTL
jgi:hypothetical protein